VEGSFADAARVTPNRGKCWENMLEFCKDSSHRTPSQLCRNLCKQQSFRMQGQSEVSVPPRSSVSPDSSAEPTRRSDLTASRLAGESAGSLLPHRCMASNTQLWRKLRSAFARLSAKRPIKTAFLCASAVSETVSESTDSVTKNIAELRRVPLAFLSKTAIFLIFCRAVSVRFRPSPPTLNACA
jgi:hypothetical protein